MGLPPSVVASGVAEALVTTAAGLVIAVPAVLLFNHFTRRLNVMLTVAENHARSLRAATSELSAPNAVRQPESTVPARSGARTHRDEPQPVGSSSA